MALNMTIKNEIEFHRFFKDADLYFLTDASFYI